jgi:hypothetical protein
LNCPPKKYSNSMLEYSPVTILGEESLSFMNNKKSAFIQNNYFFNCSCLYSGALQVLSINNLTINENIFILNFGINGGSLGLLFSSKTLMYKNIFLGSNSYAGGGAVTVIQIQNLSVYHNLDFYSVGISSGAWLIMYSKFFMSESMGLNVSAKIQGGFATIINSYAQFIKLKLSNPTAFFGGAFFVSDRSLSNIYCESSSANYGGFICVEEARLVTVADSIFFGNNAEVNGAVLYINGPEKIIMSNINIVAASAKNFGIIYLKTDNETSLNIFENISCERSSAKEGSCIFFLSNSILMIADIQINECRGPSVKLKSLSLNKITIKRFKAFYVLNADYLLLLEGKKRPSQSRRFFDIL